MENTKIRTNSPSKPSSTMEARKILAPWVDHVPSLVRVAASRVITRIRRIEAIRPTTRNGSVTKMCERMETRTVCRISTSISTTKSWCQHSQNLDCDRAVAQALPEQPGSTRDRHQCRDRKQHCDDGVDDHLSLAQIVAKVIPQMCSTICEESYHQTPRISASIYQ